MGFSQGKGCQFFLIKLYYNISLLPYFINVYFFYVNEGELSRQCAVRETLEEVGFDASDYISDKIRPLQNFINDTLVQ
jgi:hypothetical protein